MSLLVLTVLTAAAVWIGTLFFAFDAAAYRSLRRAVQRGDLSDIPSEEVRPVRMNALGQNPDITYRYTAYEIPQGKAAVMRGRVHPNATYTSIMVYDRLLQSIRPERTTGPTWVNKEGLQLDPRGCFELVLAHRDPGDRPWLDVSGAPRGIVFERHIGAAPDRMSRVEVLPIDSLQDLE